jgi:hypothetical protein
MDTYPLPERTRLHVARSGNGRLVMLRSKGPLQEPSVGGAELELLQRLGESPRRRPRSDSPSRTYLPRQRWF